MAMLLKNNKVFLIGYIIVLSFTLGLLTQKYLIKGSLAPAEPKEKTINLETLQEQVIPQKGYTFKIKWGDLGKKMVEDGVIDKKKLAQALTGTDDLPTEYEKYLDGSEKDLIELNETNSHFWVDVLWGLGLAQKSKILEEGQMIASGDASRFASTGGYTLGVLDPMQYYSKYSYIQLSPEQEAKVRQIAEGVYRPCCGNSTAFPDCNHGMAALALIELMVAQNFSEEEIYKTVLAFNSYWFPQTYLDIAYNFAKNDQDFQKIPARELLGKTLSSAMGYAAVQKQVGQIDWPALKGGGSCGA